MGGEKSRGRGSTPRACSGDQTYQNGEIDVGECIFIYQMQSTQFVKCSRVLFTFYLCKSE